MRTAFLLASCLTLTLEFAALGQDSPSLGDVARQARQQKQDQEAQGNGDASATKPKKVITNEQISSGTYAEPQGSNAVAGARDSTNSSSSSADTKQPAEFWRSQILTQKQSVATLEAEIARVNDSIQFAPGNCVSGCVQWNEQQQKKQQEVERMRGQLDTMKQRLQDLQEGARQQGYGSSVYDP